MPLLRLRVPKDPINAVEYLDHIERLARIEINDLRAQVYFQARLDGLFEETLAAGVTSRKRALQMVRHINDRLGRPVRWRDGADPSSSYRG